MSRRHRTVLGIDPAARGFAFAVLEGPDFLVDWGLRGTRVRTRSEMLIDVQALLDEYKPDVVVVEDPATSRLGARGKTLIQSIAQLAAKRGVTCRRAVRRGKLGDARNKHEVALKLVERFPELGPVLPPKRRVYESENMRMRVFGAVFLCTPT